MAHGASGDLQQVVVRMPVDLHEAVKERADQEERTVAQTIRHAVRLYLRTDEAR